MRECVRACARNGACPAVEVGGRVLPSGVFSTFGASRLFLPVLVSRPFVRPSSSRRTKHGPECKVEKTVADKMVLFEQKRPGLVMFLRGRNRAEKHRGRGSSLALHEYYSNERCCVVVVVVVVVVFASFSPLSFRDSNVALCRSNPPSFFLSCRTEMVEKRRVKVTV